MSNDTIIGEKKKALLAQKAKLIEDLKYYEKRIEEEKTKRKVDFYLDASSDSDDDICIIDHGPSLTQLKLQQSKLRTCLQATQELTNLQILQSEVNIVVNDPVITGEPPVKRPGTWREVTAECRMDLVPFSITFYTHKADGKFGPTSYRGLNVMLVKAAHEAELSKSVLPTVVRPSDAIEVLRSYAEAYRSRRSSLARLATKYSDSLFMEPLVEGGYLLKCANLLQVAWRLENKWSPLAPFHHRMKFDLEYMEEKYINIITQCHKKLSDPTISTDERTLLLSKIIATCLEANPVSESAESDQEVRLSKRRATLDQEIDEPENKKQKEVMAPPKSLPKKAKVSKINANSRSNDNSDRNRANENNRQSDRENVDNNVARNTVRSDTSKSGQKTVEKVPKTTGNMKDVGSANNKNTDTATVNKQKENNKKLKSLAQNINSDNQPENAEEAQTGKKSELKDQTKKVTNNKNADTVSNKKPKAFASAKTNQLIEGADKANNTEQQKGVYKEKTVTSGKKNNKTPEVNAASENIDKGIEKKLSTKGKLAQSNKKVSKENINVNNAKNVHSNEKEPITAPKFINKAQNLASAHKTVEKNANNKVKDKIADIATKVTKSKNKITSNKDLDNNTNAVKRQTATEATKTVKHIDKTSVANGNNTTKKVPDNNDVEREERESNDVAPATTKSSNIEKNANNIGAIKKNKITTEKRPETNNERLNRQTSETESIPTKIKKSNVEKNAEKNGVANGRNKIVVKDKQKLSEKDHVNTKIKTSDTETTKKIVTENVHTNSNNINVLKILTEKERVLKAKSQENMNKKHTKKDKKSVLPLRMQNNLKMSRKSIGNIKVAVKQSEVKAKSKIPQKKLHPLNENVLKRNPLRMSPRHMATTFNSTSSSVKQNMQKTTHIPRLAMFKAK